MEKIFELKEKARDKLIYEYWYDKLMEIGINDIPNEDLQKDINEYIHNRSSYKKCRYKYIMFTINFVPMIDEKKVLKKIEKAVKKKWIANYIWCIEWRDKDIGMHAHIRVEIKADKRTYECKREMYNTFKDCVGNKQHVNCVYGTRKDSFIDYVKGFKRKVKKPNSEYDTINRIKLGLKDYYEG